MVWRSYAGWKQVYYHRCHLGGRGRCRSRAQARYDRDKTKDGYDIPMTKTIAEAVDIPVKGIRRRRGGGAHLWGVCGRGGCVSLRASVIPLRDVCWG
uniref:Uncharacterized protein n=1 Tax=Candidatus Methanogaster sp. ANME-2c ERB4 TaxID=2759911 RepID=A0A7G9YLI1_9EURY|nr:hypothetical protein JECKPIEH_00004 [Methanosarcinales archaeon ANME-2c ERB4]